MKSIDAGIIQFSSLQSSVLCQMASIKLSRVKHFYKAPVIKKDYTMEICKNGINIVQPTEMCTMRLKAKRYYPLHTCRRVGSIFRLEGHQKCKPQIESRSRYLITK